MCVYHISPTYHSRCGQQQTLWEAKSSYFCLFGATILYNVIFTKKIRDVMHICALSFFGNCAPCSLEAKRTLSDSSLSRHFYQHILHF